jgi:hypothetical protein
MDPLYSLLPIQSAICLQALHADSRVMSYWHSAMIWQMSRTSTPVVWLTLPMNELLLFSKDTNRH